MIVDCIRGKLLAALVTPMHAARASDVIATAVFDRGRLAAGTTEYLI